MGANLADKAGVLLESAWAASALAQLLDRGADRRVATGDPAAALLLKAGLLEDDGDGDGYVLAGRDELGDFEPVLLALIRSSLGQAYAIATGQSGWSHHDPEVLLAQGQASSAGGRGLAGMVQAIPGLRERFGRGGVLLDVGVGVGALACAFCEAVPGARVIGLDVLPPALELARQLVRDRGLEDRVELRRVGVEELDQEGVADLAHMSPVFIPPSLVTQALKRIHRALHPGGWLALSGIVGDGPDGATTRWMAHGAGGSALTRADVSRLAAETGYGEPSVPPVPLPPGAGVLILRKEQSTA